MLTIPNCTMGIVVFGDRMQIRYINPYAQRLMQDHRSRGSVNESVVGMDLAVLVAQARDHAPAKMVSRMSGPWDGTNSITLDPMSFRLHAMALSNGLDVDRAPVLVLIKPIKRAEHRADDPKQVPGN